MLHAMLRGAALCAVAVFLSNGSAAWAAESEPSLVGVVNVNTATAAQLEMLPGVGPARAQAIIAHREQHGAFESPRELIAVSGIGERALARLEPFVATRGETTVRRE